MRASGGQGASAPLADRYSASLSVLQGNLVASSLVLPDGHSTRELSLACYPCGHNSGWIRPKLGNPDLLQQAKIGRGRILYIWTKVQQLYNTDDQMYRMTCQQALGTVITGGRMWL